MSRELLRAVTAEAIGTFALVFARTLHRIPLAAVYSSPSTRALDTAGPLAAAHQLTPPVEDALREIDFGELEGRSYDGDPSRLPGPLPVLDGDTDAR
jgi:hypothetical protein